MEGQNSKIRTMAKDMEAAKKELESKSKDFGGAEKSEISHNAEISKSSVPPAPNSVGTQSAHKTESSQSQKSPSRDQAADTQNFTMPSRQTPVPPPIRPRAQEQPAPKIPAGPVSDIEPKKEAAPEKSLSEILNEARSRIESRATQMLPDKSAPAPPASNSPKKSPTERLKQPPAERPMPSGASLDDILPIEEGVPSVATPQTTPPFSPPKIQSPASKEVPLPPKTTLPANLPFEKSERPFEKKIEPSPGFPQKSQAPADREKTIPLKETPEEILGISDKTAPYEPSAKKHFGRVAPQSPPPAMSGAAQKAASDAVLTPEELSEMAPREKTPVPKEAPAPAPTIESIVEKGKGAEGEVDMETIEKEFESVKKGGGSGIGKILKVLLVFVLLGGLSGGGYFAYLKFFTAVPEEAPPKEEKDERPTTQVTRPEPPSSLIPADSVQVIEIENLSEIQAELRQLTGEPSSEAWITYLPIFLSGANEAHYVTLPELFSAIGIPIPAILRDYEAFSLFLYRQTLAHRELCFSAGILNRDCFGPRLGVVIDTGSKQGTTAEEERGALLKALADWESATMTRDLAPLILMDVSASTPGPFSSGIHRNLSTRYVNMPIETVSIDWILADNYLVIATSRDSARAAVDRLP